MGKQNYQDDLAPDAVLAEDLGDEQERLKDQIAHLGGEIDEDLDEEDFENADRGDTIVDEAEVKARQEEAGAKPKDDDDADEDDDSDRGDDADSDDDDSESADSDDDDSDESDSDEDEDDGEEDEDEDEGEEGEEDEEDSDSRKRPPGIPKHRFDEVNERMKRAERRLEELERERTAGEEAQREEYDFDAAEQEYIELVQDGRTSDALAKRKEIRAAERAQWQEETVEQSTRTIDAQHVEREITDLSKQAEQAYPVFDENHPDYDRRITNQAMAYFRGYAESGEYDNPADAFVAALSDVIDLHGLDKRYGEEPAQEDPKPEPKPAPKKKKKKNTDKALSDKARQHTPAASGGTAGKDAGAAVPDVSKMSDEELDRLDEETLARLRGDFF